MATHDYVIANASGAAVRADLNNALAAIVTNNSNATEPATTYAYMLWYDTTDNQLKQRNATDDAWIIIQDSDALSIDSSANVGIGTTTPTAALHVLGNQTRAFIDSTNSTSTVGVTFGDTGTVVGAVLYDNSNDAMLFRTNGTTERARIQSDGAFLFGTTTEPSSGTGGSAFTPSTNERMILDLRTNTASSNFVARFYNSNGRVGTISTDGSNTAYNTSSDYRLKENIIPVADAITRLQQLKPSRFNFIADPDTTVDGFIAHEVQSIVPEAITGEKDAVDENGDPEYQGIDQSKLVPLLTAALQEAVAKIETLEAKVAVLEAN